jgi:hypothetical protein
MDDAKHRIARVGRAWVAIVYGWRRTGQAMACAVARLEAVAGIAIRT